MREAKRLRTAVAKERTYRSFFRAMEAIPLSVRAVLLETMMLCVWAASPERRQIARINLRIAFPEMGDATANRIIRRCYINLGTAAAEFLHIPKMDADYLSRHFRVEGAEHYRRSEQELGLGPLAITGHFGSWELLAHVYGSVVGPAAFVVRTFKDEFLDTFVNDRRQFSGNNKVIRKSGSVRDVIRTIRNKTPVGILIDKNIKPKKGVFVDFFTRKAYTTPWVARLALATGANVHSAFIFRDPKRKFHHTLRLGPSIPIDRTAPREDEVVRLTRRCNGELENAIREDPTQWVWFYRRWETKGAKGIDIYDEGFESTQNVQGRVRTSST